MYLTRKLEQKLLNLSASFPVVMVTGARQVGKTTMLKQIGKGMGFVSLDIPDNRVFANEEPAAFLAKHKPPVIIDEFQYAPKLLHYIKAYVDETKRYGDFWLTGSQTFASMENVAESLAGRVGIVNLFSFSQSELSGVLFDEYTADIDSLIKRQKQTAAVNKSETFKKILKGGMPRVHEDTPATVQDYFDSYFQTYLSRDIRNLAQVADELSFYKFMQVCGLLAAEQVDYAKISNRAGITAAKAKHWVSVLVSSGIAILLPPYFNNALKRVVKTPKLYFMDSGLLCYLRGIQNAEVLEKLSGSGVFFENFVVSEIYKSFANAGMRPPLFFYRDTSGNNEIDLIIEQNGMCHPIEIKESTNPDKNAAKHFGVLAATGGMPVGTGSVICNSQEIYPVGKNIWAVPHWVV